MQGSALCVLFQQSLVLVSPLFLRPERRKHNQVGSREISLILL